VDVDIIKPLMRVDRINVEGKLKWIRLEYAIISDFCYICA